MYNLRITGINNNDHVYTESYQIGNLKFNCFYFESSALYLKGELQLLHLKKTLTAKAIVFYLSLRLCHSMRIHSLPHGSPCL